MEVAAACADSFLPEERSGFQLLEEKGQRRGTTPCHGSSRASSRQKLGSPQGAITSPEKVKGQPWPCPLSSGTRQE